MRAVRLTEQNTFISVISSPTLKEWQQQARTAADVHNDQLQCGARQGLEPRARAVQTRSGKTGHRHIRQCD